MRKTIAFIMCLVLLLTFGAVNAVADTVKVTTEVPQMECSISSGGTGYAVYLNNKRVDGTTIAMDRFEEFTLTIAPAEGKFVQTHTFNGETMDTEDGLNYVLSLSELENEVKFTVADIPTSVLALSCSASLTLNSVIPVNVFLRGYAEDFDVTKLSVLVNGKALSADAITQNKDSVSVLAAALAPNELSTILHTEVKYDGVTVKLFNYSVRHYCEKVFETYAESDPLYYLCEALLTYGKYAEDYSNELAGAAAEASALNKGYGISLGQPVAVAATKVSNANYVTSAEAGVAISPTISLVYRVTTTSKVRELTADDVQILNSKNRKVSADQITFTKLEDGSYEVVISGLSAKQLSERYKLTLNNKWKLSPYRYAYTYGVYNYCEDMQSAEVSSTLKSLCKAIYAYGEADRVYTSGKK